MIAGRLKDALARPEHTGSNRCWPCTAVNLALVTLTAAVCVRRERRLTGLLALSAGIVAIALRGYVVPYTPRFAPKLVGLTPMPESWFGKSAGADRDSLAATEFDGERVLRDLSAAGVLESGGGVVRPTESVDRTWHREQTRLGELSLEELAATASGELPGVSGVQSYDDGGSGWLVVDGDLVAAPVAVAELAAHRALADAVADPDLRAAGARAFRMFLDSCPVCGTTLVSSSEVSCCGGYTDPTGTPAETLVCPACEQRLYTFPSE
jgi:hypothetical protein